MINKEFAFFQVLRYFFDQNLLEHENEFINILLCFTRTTFCKSTRLCINDLIETFKLFRKWRFKNF